MADHDRHASDPRNAADTVEAELMDCCAEGAPTPAEAAPEERAPQPRDTHDHSHAHASASRGRLAWALAITATILVAEFVGALLTGSLALAADAGHMLVDSSGLVIALVAAHLMTRPRDDLHTWGW